MNKYELYHHGVLGMKWGIRRYQNADGTLTEAGKKRYGKMSDDKLSKNLYKQVKKKRSEQSNWSNQWNVSNTIGKNSKAVEDRYKKDRAAYEHTEQYKDFIKKLKNLDKRFEQGKIDPDMKK